LSRTRDSTAIHVPPLQPDDVVDMPDSTPPFALAYPTNQAAGAPVAAPAPGGAPAPGASPAPGAIPGGAVGVPAAGGLPGPLPPLEGAPGAGLAPPSALSPQPGGPVPGVAPPAGGRSLAVRLDLPGGFPGSRLGVSGTGCEAGAPVVLTAGATVLGSATAALDGTFSAVFTLPQLPVGRVSVTATCGDRTGGALFDAVVARRVDVGTSAFFVLLFFVLIAFAMRKQLL
jgi:hypothetical protein